MTTRTVRALARVDGLDGHPLPIAVIRKGQRWYLSPTTTALESVRRALRLPPPDFTAAPSTGAGATTAKGAVTGLVHAVQEHDLSAAAGYLSSADGPAAAWYLPSFAGLLASLVGGAHGEVSGLTLATQGMSDGLQKITITGFSTSGTTAQGASGSLHYRSGCVSVGAADQPTCLPDVVRQLLGISRPFVVVDYESGSWRVSPVATVLEYLRLYLLHGSIDGLLRLVEIPQLAPVAATLAVGQSSTVRLNPAAFAHILITGAPGTCVRAALDQDARLAVASSAACGTGFPIPSSGTADGVVVAALAQASIPVRISLTAQ